MIAALLPVLGPLVGDVVKRILPEDKDKRMEIERELNMAIMQNGAAIEQAAASVIKAEAESEHKITATLPEELWNLLMIGVGGYVVGRSGEKIAKNIKK